MFDRASLFQSSLLMVCLHLSGIVAFGAESAAWMRYPAISPDGQTIAFAYMGDIWVVPATGGTAQALTTHVAHEKTPIWSPDSQQIAFASDRHGQYDVFLVSARGGQAKRLTYHSAADTPTAFTRDGKAILFASRRQDAPEAALGGLNQEELYQIPCDGGRPVQVLTTPAEDAVPSPDGKRIAYHDYKGYEDHWRKHHTSSVTRDIWIYDIETGSHTKLSGFRGEDREPVWAADGKGLYYLSERSGSFNIWQQECMPEAEPECITNHGPHPVRFLSIADDGTLCYGYNGQIWRKPRDGESQQVAIQAIAGDRVNAEQIKMIKDGATEFAVAPNEEEIAFVVRGEVFVTSVEHGTTKRITHTPTQERSVAWGKDGRTLFYAGERDRSWNLYQTQLPREDDQGFATATMLTEEPVLVHDAETFQPLPSPDGKKIAYLENRDTIKVLDLDTKETSVLVPAKRNYSYSDGDITYHWSPDSKWLSFTYSAHQRWLTDVGVVNVATGEITNITDSGYAEQGPHWASNAKALLFLSDRRGRRNHGSWGSDQDVFALYLTQQAYDRASLSKEDFDLLKKTEEKAKTAKEKAKEAQDKDTDDEDAKPMAIDLNDLEHRLKRLTLHSAPISSMALSPDGETLVYIANVEDKWDLWLCKIRDRSTMKVATLGDSSGGEVVFAKDGKSLLVRKGNGTLAKGTLKDDKVTLKPIPFTAEMTIHGPKERAYLFEHIRRQVQAKFYRGDLHGVDWDGLKENYAAFLPTVTTTADFAELMSEMLGELNASHTGCRYRPKRPDADATASLGLLVDVRHPGVGLKVVEVLERGPADTAQSKIKPGVIVTHLDGTRLTPNVNPYALLNRKAGKRLRLALTDPATNETWEETLKPISLATEVQFLYDRWVEGRRQAVEAWSDGTIGYVHIRGMNDPSFRQVYQDVLGKNSDKAALIVDTRFNGGGWLHDDLVTFLDGEDYIYFVPRGKQKGDLGAEPFERWTRPVAVVMSESNYSDAHMFPYAFQQLKLGPLVGAPVPGTGTAVWWETLIDPSLVFGIPQVGMMTPDGDYLENTQLEPDYLVSNDPASVAKGEDPQLKKAVEVLAGSLKTKE